MLEDLGMPKFDAQEKPYALYSLRHSFATQKVHEGKVPVYQLAKYMGTSIAMFEKHYVHSNPDIYRDEIAPAGLVAELRANDRKREADAKVAAKAQKEASRDAKLDELVAGQRLLLGALAGMGKKLSISDETGRTVQLVQGRDGIYREKK